MASSKDVELKIKLLIEKHSSSALTKKELVEVRQSLTLLGRAIARWHQLKYEKKS